MTGEPLPPLTSLDRMMKQFNLSNHDLVRVSTQQLTHKMVQKGRKGKRLTPNVQQKIFNALKTALPEQNFRLQDLFPQDH